MSFEFNRNLDFNQFKRDYAVDKRLHIKNIWPIDAAQSISYCLEKKTEYINAYTAGGENFESTDSKLRGLSQTEYQKFIQRLYHDASQGIGFFYGRRLIKPEDNHTNQTLKNVARYLNSGEVLEKIRYVSGIKDIEFVSCKATRYLPGHFLTRHNDLHEKEHRRLAFVLGFSPKWHPDWGGLLQFYQNDGTPRDAWAPTFNSLNIFDVNHVHAVTHIAPFASAPRLTIAGFFRAK